MSRFGIKEVFNTLQGEGSRVGTRAVFVRFTGCNLWDGNPLHRDRGVGACAKWCDTDFAKGDVLSVEELISKMGEAWQPDLGKRWCVLTGGEPGLQVTTELVMMLHDYGWHIAVESNGTVECEAFHDVDHLCIAPKLGTSLNSRLLAVADELKFVLPGAGYGEPGWGFEQMQAIAAGAPNAALFVQPQDPILGSFVSQTALHRNIALDDELADDLKRVYQRNLRRCIDFVMAHPTYRLSAQVHKFIDLP